jgi:hypothetical protein
MGQKGIPTSYRVRRYRSRLEARWASFFDLIRWPYEYEPFDLDGWIPDFIILGEVPFLVEIKPVNVLDKDAVAKIEQSNCDYQVLMLGCTVPVRSAEECCKPDSFGPIGWMLLKEGSNWYTTDAYLISRGAPEIGPIFGLCGQHGPGLDRISGEDRPSDLWTWVGPHRYGTIWSEAGNKVQWNPTR